MTRQIALALFVMGTLLIIGGIILAITGSEGPEWVAKTIAIIVGALIALAGGRQIVNHH